MIDLDFKEIAKNLKICEVSGEESDLKKEAKVYLEAVDKQIQDTLENYKNDLLSYVHTNVREAVLKEYEDA